jgi:hypothetical protein
VNESVPLFGQDLSSCPVYTHYFSPYLYVLSKNRKMFKMLWFARVCLWNNQLCAISRRQKTIYSRTVSRETLKTWRRSSCLDSTVLFQRITKELNKNLWEELIAYFHFIHWPHRKWRAQQFYGYLRIPCRRNVFPEPMPSNDEGNTHVYMYKGGP